MPESERKYLVVDSCVHLPALAYEVGGYTVLGQMPAELECAVCRYLCTVTELTVPEDVGGLLEATGLNSLSSLLSLEAEEADDQGWFVVPEGDEEATWRLVGAGWLEGDEQVDGDSRDPDAERYSSFRFTERGHKAAAFLHHFVMERAELAALRTLATRFADQAAKGGVEDAQS